MDQATEQALRGDHIIDITTTGRTTGQPRRIEISIAALNGGFYITGRPGRPRSWYANLRANPEFTLHLKRSLQADLRTRATAITDHAERRAVFSEMAAQGGNRGVTDVEEWVEKAPLVRLEFLE